MSTTNSLLINSLAALGALSVGVFGLKVLDFIRVYALLPSRLPRYQHADPSTTQEAKSWALVTGASDGIGLAFATELAHRGFNVVLHGRNPTKLDDKVSQLKSKFPRISFRSVIADASDSHGMQKRVAEIAAEMESLPGPLTVVINNAGGVTATTGKQFSVFMELPAEDIDGTINLNLRFPTQLTRTLLPLLKRNAPGLVMVIGSGAGEFNAPYLTIYGGSKAYLKVWTQSVAAEMGLEGVDVEVLGINVGEVTGTFANTAPPSILAPSSTAFAKTVLNRVGCGKVWLCGYWAHALQIGFITSLPTSVMQRAIAGIMTDLKNRLDKKGT